MTARTPRILNVDDNEASRYVKSRVLRRAGYEVHEAGSIAGALLENHDIADAGVQFTNVTLSANGATANGNGALWSTGGVLLGSLQNGKLTAGNTIVSGNTAARGAASSCTTTALQ